jgi:hypothetical protein
MTTATVRGKALPTLARRLERFAPSPDGLQTRAGILMEASLLEAPPPPPPAVVMLSMMTDTHGLLHSNYLPGWLLDYSKDFRAVFDPLNQDSFLVCTPDELACFEALPTDDLRVPGEVDWDSRGMLAWVLDLRRHLDYAKAIQGGCIMTIDCIGGILGDDEVIGH